MVRYAVTPSQDIYEQRGEKTGTTCNVMGSKLHLEPGRGRLGKRGDLMALRRDGGTGDHTYVIVLRGTDEARSFKYHRCKKGGASITIFPRASCFVLPGFK